MLESEERQRLDALRAHVEALEAEERPTPAQVNNLLVSALQAHSTLFRMSRVFPHASASRRVNAMEALDHVPTAALACQLHRCWGALGVTAATQKLILLKALTTVGTETAEYRKEFFADVRPFDRKHADPTAHEGLSAEGSG